MKWIIKNPAPNDSRRNNWGDHYFGQSLANALREQGQSVSMHYHEQWFDADEAADIVLVLRGRHRYRRAGRSRTAIHIMWNISHPDDVSLEEYNEFDLVGVASSTHAHKIRRNHFGRVFPLLQCTDTTRFFLPIDWQEQGRFRNGVVFVGNTRGQRRPAVLELAGVNPALRVWGRGWDKAGVSNLVVAETIDNADIAEVYQNARIGLNDHWPDMVERGFINNRIFDALACGLPVLTDLHPAIAELFGGRCGVVYATEGNFREALGRMLLEYPRLLEQASKTARVVVEKHSFAARALELVEVVSEFSESGRRVAGG